MKKAVLITGASRGIGRETARLFAKDGYELYLLCHTQEALLLSLKQELARSCAGACHIYTGDVGNPSFIKQVFASVPRLDVLVNNAGVSYMGLLHDMTFEDWHRVMDTNLSAVFYTCKYAVPLMLAEHAGHIINVSSVWGSCGASMETAYSASKGGVNALTKALAKELAPSNIQVNAAAFGVIDTAMNAHLSAEELEALRQEIPADRIAGAAEAAELILQLAQSPAYLTGQIITMDGGWT